MTREELTKLAERVEGLTGWCRDTNAEVALVAGWTPTQFGSEQRDGWLSPSGHIVGALPSFFTSLDAAMSLVPEGWEGVVHIGSDPGAGLYQLNNPRSHKNSRAATPALALTAAALRARAEQLP